MSKDQMWMNFIKDNFISRQYFIQVLNWITIANTISGIIAIGVILFLYKLWKKSSEANEILYMKNKELTNEKEERKKHEN